jgi:hypothetical protein
MSQMIQMITDTKFVYATFGLTGALLGGICLFERFDNDKKNSKNNICKIKETTDYLTNIVEIPLTSTLFGYVAALNFDLINNNKNMIDPFSFILLHGIGYIIGSKYISIDKYEPEEIKEYVLFTRLKRLSWIPLTGVLFTTFSFGLNKLIFNTIKINK